MKTSLDSAQKVLDILSSSEEYPSSALSNFAYYRFTVDEIKCCSMEGFLQSLKFKNKRLQQKVCRLYGKKAKNAPGWLRNHIWRLSGILYWKGRPICRYSDEYQLLLDRAYDRLFKNKEFKKALRASSNRRLSHSIGKTDRRKTVLTEYEFITRLNRLRSVMDKE